MPTSSAVSSAAGAIRPAEPTTGLTGRVPARPAPETSWWDWFRVGQREEPDPSFLGLVEDPDANDPAVGICCSGGGIRSAAFNLGALQVLSRKRVLQKAKYLSAVSGGSYIAASIFMVAKTGPANREARHEAADVPTPAPSHDDSDWHLVDKDHLPFHPGSPEEQYLRNRSSYLAPGGLGKLFLAFRVLMGLVFNLCFLGLIVFAAGVALGKLVYQQWFGVLDGMKTCAPDTACFTASVPLGAWLILGAVGVAIVGLGAWVLLSRTSDEDWRRFRETWAVRLLLLEGLLIVVLLAVPVLLEVVRDYAAQRGADEATGVATSPALPAVGAGSVASLLLAVLLQVRAKASEPASVLRSAKGFRAVLRQLGPRLRIAFAYLAGAVAGPIVLLAFLLFGASFALAHSGDGWLGLTPYAAFGGSLATFIALYLFADLTSWSLHPFYKRRLCTAFALKRVEREDGTPEACERNYENLVPLSDMEVQPPTGEASWPTLIVCAAANVSDPGATPPGRGVTSFTFSPTEIGGPLVGGVSTRDYEDTLGAHRRRDITLPAVVAMSGAALSPSMGKLTRKPLTFLMALANVRLGVWIPNPRRLDEWKRRALLVWGEKAGSDRDVRMRPRPSYLFRELIGRNRLDAKFLYVSDGGHYENLGLVELLRRGCLRVYCFDASGGTSLTALGDAIALARSELKVEVAVDPRPLVPDEERGLAKQDCVTGTITYPDGQRGTLIYARTVMTAEVPWDVHAYHEGDPTFPHTTTADQLYTDQKFEAYRALGVWAGQHAFSAMESTATKQASRDAEPKGALVRQHDASELLRDGSEVLPAVQGGRRRTGTARFQRRRFYVAVGIDADDDEPAGDVRSQHEEEPG